MSRHRYDRGPAETHHGSARGARSKEPPRRSRLYRRPRGSAKIMGVCGGIADYLVMFTVPTLIGYFLLAWLLDEEPEGLFESEEEEVFWRHVRTEPSQTLAGLKHRFRTLELRLRDMEAYVTSPAFKIDRELR
jgi:phage shock protein C